MSGQKMSANNGFMFDDSGKFVLVPLQLPKTNQFSEFSRSTNKNTSARKKIHIERLPQLQLQQIQNVASPPRKARKLDNTVRKNLFKFPATRSSIARKSYAGSSNIQWKKPQTRPPITSPLVPIEEAEKQLNVPPCTRNPPLVCITEPSDDSKPETTPNNKTPDSDYDFNQLEKLCDEKQAAPSPLSSVCNLLESTKLTNSPTRGIIQEIENIFQENKRQHQQNLQNILQIVEKDRRQTEEAQNQVKEKVAAFLGSNNINKPQKSARRSDRIAAQSTGKENLTSSPGISKNVDLRKSTLNKNLTKSITIEVQSPKMKRAVSMYNTLRSNCSILCTPKMDRTELNCTQISSAKRSLSRKIQQQCLMLQDTPTTKQ